MTSRCSKEILFCILFLMTLNSCKKFLDTKSNKSLSTPESLQDLQALLDNEDFQIKGVGATQTGSDEYYVPFSTWESNADELKLGYSWDPKTDNFSDWQNQYLLILITNTVLDNIEKLVAETPGRAADEIKGSALFLRSHSYYQLAQIYASQYDPATASDDLGIVLRTDSDFNKPSRRSSIRETYDQIVNDLQKAVNLLPTRVTANTRPNKAAGYALLARVFLQMGDFTKAKDAADQALTLYDALIDFNDVNEVDTSSNSPIVHAGVENKEILFYVQEDRSLMSNPAAAIVDSMLYASYDNKDIRKTAFFFPAADSGTYSFKGSYIGSAGYMFVGISTPEVYLIRAECNARLNNIKAAFDDLNVLLSKRYLSGAAPVLSAITSDEALAIVLAERKREMLGRGMRWADLKRLNKKPSTAVTLKRELNGAIYTLPPNDKRYTLLIPRNVLELVDMPQNPR